MDYYSELRAMNTLRPPMTARSRRILRGRLGLRRGDALSKQREDRRRTASARRDDDEYSGRSRVSAHTTGPWHIDGSDVFAKRTLGRRLLDRYRRPDLKYAPNARLIAAAPDLLQASTICFLIESTR